MRQNIAKKLDKEPKLILDLSKHSRLKGFIVIYNDNRKPALGGTRIADYASELDALLDATKLAEAMAYKSAIAGLPFGGAKGVVINDPTVSKKEILEEYAKQVHKLKGSFYTGEDVGLEEIDVQYMMKVSPYFVGRTGLAGDPSYFAALSTFKSIKVALKFIFGSDDISGRSFAVKGVGKTGSFLVKMLAEGGGQICITDLDENKIHPLELTYENVKRCTTPIEECDVDVFCPCAMGNDITIMNVKKVKAKMIVGTANNQLESAEVGDVLDKLDILYVPDYIANAGGLLDVADELMPNGYNKDRVLTSIDKLQETLKSVLIRSKSEAISPLRVANDIAEKIFLHEKIKHGT